MKKLVIMIMAIGVIFLWSIVSADTSMVFEEKNQIKYIDGHEIILVEATKDKECIFTVDGDSSIIVEDNEETINDVKIYVKDALAIRTKSKKSEYCNVLIDVLKPGNKKMPETAKTEKKEGANIQPNKITPETVEPKTNDDETQENQSIIVQESKETKRSFFKSLIERCINFLKLRLG